MVEKVSNLSVVDFTRLYEKEGPFEVVNGERVALSPTVMGHSLIIKTVFLALHSYLTANNLGEAFTETPFVLTDDSDWVHGSRTPDVMVVLRSRLEAYRQQTEDWRSKPLVLVPDLVVEVISATDRYTDVRAKVDQYVQDGVQVVWVIDPRRSEVTVYEGETIHSLRDDATLQSETLLPDFGMELRRIFDV